MNVPSKKVCVIIPAYNESGAIKNVVNSVKDCYPTADIIVINDASTDNTGAIASTLGIPVLHLPINLGIGGAMQTGFKYAVKKGYDIAIQVDGDGQHNPTYIPTILKPIHENKADVVIGSRFLHKESYRSSFMRLIGIRFCSYLISLATNRYIHDSTSGFRAYNKEALGFAARYYPPDFPEPESIVTFLRNGFRVKEVPVAMQQRQSGISSIHPLKGTYFVASNSIGIIMSSFKRKTRTISHL
ncbi:MAG: glycosyltransferase family 2 protein [Candidatus Andersenbacteria bacterium]|nr:glycosyltransferase family 2 protein [Candidatus Andersenbacteria bacterium]